MIRSHGGRLCAAAAAVLAAKAWGQVPPELLIVELVDGASIDEVNQTHGTTVSASLPGRPIYLLDPPPGLDEKGLDQLESDLENDPRVLEVDLNDAEESPGGGSQSFFFYVPPSMVPTQYAWSRIGLPNAQLVSTGAGIRVAVLDTGIDPDHGLFDQVAVELAAGNNFIEPGALPVDAGDGVDRDQDGVVDESVGHGTFMAGLIAFMAPDATIIPIRVLDGEGWGTAFTVAGGIYRAVDDVLADVINLSLGNEESNDIIDAALTYAQAQGVIVIASAGNDNTSDPQFPASSAEAVGVAATDAGDVKTGFSSYGSEIDLTAPGSAIASAVVGGLYGSADGTSMSAALVTGAAVIVSAAQPQATPDEVLLLLTESADDIDAVNPDYEGELGSGRVNVAAALGVAGLPFGDLNADGSVGFLDSLELMASWGSCDPVPRICPADLSDDGTVGIVDLFILMANWS